MLHKAGCRWANSILHQSMWRERVTESIIKYQMTRAFSVSSCLRVAITPPLSAEPPKKSVRVDPAIDKARKERMVKRLLKVQHKLGEPDLKPVEEFMYDPRILTEARKRPDPNLMFEEEERRALLQKKWNKYRAAIHAEETHQIETAKQSQQRALEELRAESEVLYQKAVEKDFFLFPLEIKGPTHTPPIKGYKERLSLDGEYVDKTKQFK
ncbi:large ribosomal subunit protein mL40-like [Amphiura filiformis]|uniref:large ribosomal subunit protein mL40-like n=1 Tax=Amphiura filiformis TaxID=82378 RepID=UPI003B21A5C3